MGAWGSAPWDNDTAADWYADLFKATGLADHVAKALDADPTEEADVIRAAAHVLVQLGRVYVWPVRVLDQHLTLAISKLKAVRELEEFQDAPGFVEAIDADIAELRGRLRPPKTPGGTGG